MRDVVRRPSEERCDLGWVDHVVGRCDYVVRARGGGVVAETSKRTDLGHETPFFKGSGTDLGI
jgi:hypothetical protein